MIFLKQPSWKLAEITETVESAFVKRKPIKTY